MILVDQIRTIDRDKFLDKIGEVEKGEMEEVEKRIHLVLSLKNCGMTPASPPSFSTKTSCQYIPNKVS